MQKWFTKIYIINFITNSNINTTTTNYNNTIPIKIKQWI